MLQNDSSCSCVCHWKWPRGEWHAIEVWVIYRRFHFNSLSVDASFGRTNARPTTKCFRLHFWLDALQFCHLVWHLFRYECTCECVCVRWVVWPPDSWYTYEISCLSDHTAESEKLIPFADTRTHIACVACACMWVFAAWLVPEIPYEFHCIVCHLFYIFYTTFFSLFLK